MEGSVVNLDTILDQARSWTFAGDFQLLQLMNTLSQDLESRATKTTENLNRLNNNVKSTHVALDNVANSLTALQYGNQFVECRVQDDDETSLSGGNKESNNGVAKCEKPASKEILKAFLDNNLKVLRNCHEKYSLDVDDSDEEDEKGEKTCIFQPINPYNERSLPYIYGSKEWHDKWHVGLNYDQQDNCYSGDEMSEAFSESSSSGAGDNDSYDSNSEYASSFSVGTDNFAGKFEVKNVSAIRHSKVLIADPASESSSTHSSNAKIPSLNEQLNAADGFHNRSDSVSSSNLKTETTNTKIPIAKPSGGGSLRKPSISRTNVPPYTDLFAEPPEDVGSSTSTSSLVNNTSRKPAVNLFNDDDDDVFKQLVIARSKRNDSEKPKISAPNVPTQKSNDEAVNSTKTLNPTISEEIKGGLFNKSAPPKDVLNERDQKKSELFKTTKNLFDDDDDDDDFLSAFVQKQKLHESPNTALTSDKRDDHNSDDQPSKLLFDDMKNNKSRVNLFDDSKDDVPHSIGELQREENKDDRKYKHTISKQSISNILKSTNLFDDDEDDDEEDLFKAKPSILSSIQRKIAEEKTENYESDQITEKGRNTQKDLNTNINSNLSMKGNAYNLFDDDEDVNEMLPKNFLSESLQLPKHNSKISGKSLSPIAQNSDSHNKDLSKDIVVNEEPKNINNNVEQSAANDTIISANEIQQMPMPSTEESKILNVNEYQDLVNNVNGSSVESLINELNDTQILTNPDRTEFTHHEGHKTVDENNTISGSKSSETYNAATGDKIREDNNAMLDENVIGCNESSPKSQSASDIDIPEHSKTDSISAAPLYDFNSSLIFDEPPDDNDFFETLGKSSQNRSTKYHSFGLENDLYPEPELPKMPTTEKSLEYKGLQLFSDIPPEDSDFDDVAPPKTEYTTKRLNSVFYDDFNETLLALGRNQNQTPLTQSVYSNEPPDLDIDKETIEEPVSDVGNKDMVDHKIPDGQTKTNIEDVISRNSSISHRPISKLQLPKININVQALLPNKTGKVTPIIPVQKEELKYGSTVTEPHTSFSNENVPSRTPETEHILPSINKNRVRAPANRRPSTRKARQENYRKSLLEQQNSNTDEDNRDVKGENKNTSLEGTPADNKKQSPKLLQTVEQSKPPTIDNTFWQKDTRLESENKNTAPPSSTVPVEKNMSSGSTMNTAKSPFSFFSEDEDDDNELFRSIATNNNQRPNINPLQNNETKTSEILEAKIPPANNELAGGTNSDDYNKEEVVAGLRTSAKEVIAEKHSSLGGGEKQTVSKLIFTDSESDDDLFTKLGSSKPRTIGPEKKNSTPAVKAPLAHAATKTNTSLFSDDSDEDDFLKMSSKKPLPKKSEKAKISTPAKSIFDDTDSEDGDLFNRKATKDQTTTAAKTTIKSTIQTTAAVESSKASTSKQPIADNPLADLL